MKILNIRLKNLNSLKGEYAISFEESPLRESGLFLITGNTGAGKSTILDAITLALFGLVPRFEDMNVNKKETQIMTHGTKDCYAEVEFQSLEEVYRSKWSLRKTRTGAFADSKREIAKLSPDRKDSQILATKKKEVDNLTETLLGGLDFKRFTRSVLLAQGEFAQFLKGTKDRSTILERITNSDRFSKISIASFERHKESLFELDKLKEQSSNVQLMSLEEKETLANHLKEAKEGLNEKEKIAKTQNQQLQVISKLEELEEQKNKLEENLSSLTQEVEASEIIFNQLKVHQQAIEFKPALDELESIQRNWENVLLEIEELQKSIIEKERILKNIQTQQKTLEQNLKEAKVDYSLFEKIYDEVVQLDSQIKSETKVAQSLKTEMVTLVETSLNKKQIIAKATTKKNLVLTNQEKTNKWLDRHQIYATLVGSDIIYELKNQYKELLKHQEELSLLKKKEKATALKIDDLSGQAAELKKKASNNNLELSKQQKAYAAICTNHQLDKTLPFSEHIIQVQNSQDQKDLLLQALTQINEANKKHQTTLNKIIDLNEAIDGKQVELEKRDWQFLIQEEQLSSLKEQEAYYNMIYQEQQEKNNFGDFRGKLKKDEECPLCFSTEQPFRTMDVDINYALKKAKEDLQKTETRRKNVEKEYLDIISHQRVLFISTQDLQKAKNEAVSELADIEASIHDIINNNDLHLSPLIQQKSTLETTIKDTSKLIKDYELLEKQLQQIHQELEKGTRNAENLQSQMQQNALYLKDYSEQNEEQKIALAHYSKKTLELKSAIQEVLSKFDLNESLPKAIKQLEHDKETYTEQLDAQQSQKTELEQIKLQLKNGKEQLEEAQRNEELKTIDFEKQTIIINKLQEERKELFEGDDIQGTKIDKIANLETLGAALENCTKSAQEIEQKIATNKGVFSEKAKQEKLYQLQLQKKEPSLLDAIKGIGLDNIETLKASLLDKETAQKITSQQQNLSQQINLSKEAIKNNSAQYDASLNGLKIKIEDKTVLKEEYQKLQDEIKLLLQDIGSMKEKLSQQILQEKKHTALLKKIEQHKKEVARWAMLKEVIGSSDGKKFRVFAQSITLKKLIHLANLHLRYFINGRYFLEKRMGEYQDKRPNDILEIDIVDTFQANNKRPLNTLSGGESFLASLALALGLSDLAGGKAKIESLFIDEGFGTLDADTLQVAIRALQTLQSKGKTIGVISHIEQLKQNISTQIHVVKKGGGFSHLKVIEV